MCAADHSWAEVLSRLMDRHDLDADQTAWAMREILAGDASPVQIAGFAVALRGKGETVGEVEVLVRVMYEHAVTFDVPGRAVDVVGTGGDRAHTVNLSTMAAIVVAGTGVPVVKHGNRAASSQCGTADVLEALGVRLDLPPQAVAEVGRQAGITFCFAPVFHPALRHAALARRELGVGTTFNFLGPLANPGRPQAQAVGCADLRMAPILAGVLARRGVDALVFRGDDGLDELTTTTTSRVWSASGGEVVEQALDASALGLPRTDPESLRGGDAAFNAGVVRSVLAGDPGPVREAVVLNAGAAIAVFDGAAGSLDERVAAGMVSAVDAIDSGAAAAALDRWIGVAATV